MGPLQGIVVLEAGLLIQGPQAAALLGAWGAEVIKVEKPRGGDQARWLVAGPDTDRSAFFEAMNRGKRSLTVDLRNPSGCEVFLRLVERADVVISNFKPGTMDSWGVGYEAVSTRNPRIVYATGSTFGAGGPQAQREGADLSGQAAGGIISLTGDDEGPRPVGVPVADHMAAQNLAAGIVAALFARERSGRGQWVQTSLLGGQIWAMASELTAYLMTGRVPARAGRGHGMVPTVYGIFPTADGWVAIVGVGLRDRARFFEVLGVPYLSDEFPQKLYWDDEKAKVFPLLDAAFAKATTGEWCARLDAAGIRCAAVNDLAAVVADPMVRANNYLIDVDGTVVVGSPVAFSETPARTFGSTPALGQDTDAVLADAGFGPEEIDALRRDGVV